ncbi:MAG: TraR/DksA C4-type zinc finger protein [Planctomycetes bacterium]|nr:TraR/DksA C4-type zinc finger protein [Planctomycetota bacterium]
MITTRKTAAPTKKPRTEAASSVPMEPEPKPSKPIKSRLSPKTLNEYQSLLLIKRAELVGDLSAMEAKALRSDGGNLSNVPIHMADVGSDTYDQDFMLGLAEKERERLREIDEALRRIDDRTYGVCQMTGKAIPKARLAAKPWAKYTIEAAREVEAGWGS